MGIRIYFIWIISTYFYSGIFMRLQWERTCSHLWVSFLLHNGGFCRGGSLMRGGSSPLLPPPPPRPPQQPTPLSPHRRELVGCLRLNAYVIDHLPPLGPELTASVRQRYRVRSCYARVKKCFFLLLFTCSASQTDRAPFTAVSSPFFFFLTPFLPPVPLWSVKFPWRRRALSSPANLWRSSAAVPSTRLL